MGIMSAEAWFLALWAFVQGFVVSSIADTGIDATVIPDWFNSCELLGTSTEEVRCGKFVGDKGRKPIWDRCKHIP